MNFLCEQELQRSAPYEKYIQVPEKNKFNKRWLKSDPRKNRCQRRCSQVIPCYLSIYKFHRKKKRL